MFSQNSLCKDLQLVFGFVWFDALGARSRSPQEHIVRSLCNVSRERKKNKQQTTKKFYFCFLFDFEGTREHCIAYVTCSLGILFLLLLLLMC
jgi:hypothetical protein